MESCLDCAPQPMPQSPPPIAQVPSPISLSSCSEFPNLRYFIFLHQTTFNTNFKE